MRRSSNVPSNNNNNNKKSSMNYQLLPLQNNGNNNGRGSHGLSSSNQISSLNNNNNGGNRGGNPLLHAGSGSMYTADPITSQSPLKVFQSKNSAGQGATTTQRGDVNNVGVVGGQQVPGGANDKEKMISSLTSPSIFVREPIHQQKVLQKVIPVKRLPPNLTIHNQNQKRNYSKDGSRFMNLARRENTAQATARSLPRLILKQRKEKNSRSLSFDDNQDTLKRFLLSGIHSGGDGTNNNRTTIRVQHEDKPNQNNSKGNNTNNSNNSNSSSQNQSQNNNNNNNNNKKNSKFGSNNNNKQSFVQFQFNTSEGKTASERQKDMKEKYGNDSPRLVKTSFGGNNKEVVRDSPRNLNTNNKKVVVGPPMVPTPMSIPSIFQSQVVHQSSSSSNSSNGNTSVPNFIVNKSKNPGISRINFPLRQRRHSSSRPRPRPRSAHNNNRQSSHSPHHHHHHYQGLLKGPPPPILLASSPLDETRKSLAYLEEIRARLNQSTNSRQSSRKQNKLFRRNDEQQQQQERAKPANTRVLVHSEEEYEEEEEEEVEETDDQEGTYFDDTVGLKFDFIHNGKRSLEPMELDLLPLPKDSLDKFEAFGGGLLSGGGPLHGLLSSPSELESTRFLSKKGSDEINLNRKESEELKNKRERDERGGRKQSGGENEGQTSHSGGSSTGCKQCKANSKFQIKEMRRMKDLHDDNSNLTSILKQKRELVDQLQVQIKILMRENQHLGKMIVNKDKEMDRRAHDSDSRPMSQRETSQDKSKERGGSSSPRPPPKDIPDKGLQMEGKDHPYIFVNKLSHLKSTDELKEAQSELAQLESRCEELLSDLACLKSEHGSVQGFLGDILYTLNGRGYESITGMDGSPIDLNRCKGQNYLDLKGRDQRAGKGQVRRPSGSEFMLKAIIGSQEQMIQNLISQMEEMQREAVIGDRLSCIGSPEGACEGDETTNCKEQPKLVFKNEELEKGVNKLMALLEGTCVRHPDIVLAFREQQYFMNKQKQKSVIGGKGNKKSPPGSGWGRGEESEEGNNLVSRILDRCETLCRYSRDYPGSRTGQKSSREKFHPDTSPTLIRRHSLSENCAGRKKASSSSVKGTAAGGGKGRIKEIRCASQPSIIISSKESSEWEEVEEQRSGSLHNQNPNCPHRKSQAKLNDGQCTQSNYSTEGEETGPSPDPEEESPQDESQAGQTCPHCEVKFEDESSSQIQQHLQQHLFPSQTNQQSQSST